MLMLRATTMPCAPGLARFAYRGVELAFASAFARAARARVEEKLLARSRCMAARAFRPDARIERSRRVRRRCARRGGLDLPALAHTPHDDAFAKTLEAGALDVRTSRLRLIVARGADLSLPQDGAVRIEARISAVERRDA